MTAPFKLGLTGSIGMGKSTTAALFAAQGIPVWDADAAVHRLYAQGGAAVAALAAHYPAVLAGAAINRSALKSVIARDPTALARIEAVVHPLVAADRGFSPGPRRCDRNAAGPSSGSAEASFRVCRKAWKTVG